MYEDGSIHYADVAATWEQEADFQRRTAHIHAELAQMRSAASTSQVVPTNEPPEDDVSGDPYETPEEFEFKMSRVIDGVDFHVVVHGTDTVKALVRTDMNEGTMEYRANGQWVLVGPEPNDVLDDAPMYEVTQDATAIWDAGGDTDLPLINFRPVHVDVF